MSLVHDDLNQLLDALPPGCFLIPDQGSPGAVAARLTAAVGVRRGRPVLVFASDTTKHEVMEQVVALEAAVALDSLHAGTLHAEEWTEITASMARVAGAPVVVTDTPSSPDNVCNMARQWRNDPAVFSASEASGLIVVEDLEGVHAASHIDQGSDVPGRLNILAEELRLCIVLVSGP